MAFWKFLRLRNSAWFFFGRGGGVIFGPGIFYFMLLEALGIFLGFLIFAPI